MSKLNPKEAPKGYYAVSDGVVGGSCNACAFYGADDIICGRSESVREAGGYCTAEERKDGISVIFKKGKAPKKPKTELRWIKRIVTEKQWFLVEVTKGAEVLKITEAVLEGDALYGTPHDSETKNADITIHPFEEADHAKWGTPIDLIEETKS